MSNGDDLAKGGLFAVIEKATDFNFLLQCTAFVLFLDSIFLRLHGKGIFDFIQNASNLDRSIALETSLLFLVFSFCVTVVLPLVGGILDPIYIQYVSARITSLSNIFKTDDSREFTYQRKYNCAHSTEVRDAAHEQQSSFLLGLYEQHRTKILERHVSSMRSGFYSFCLLASLAVNYWCATPVAASSMTRRIAEYCDSGAPISIAFVLLVVLTYRRFHENERDEEWIYHPPLYRALQAEADERKTKSEEFIRREKYQDELSNQMDSGALAE
jgi:hypothetical protein